MNSDKDATAILVDSNYLGPVALFAGMQSLSTILIDIRQPFRKSTWQNRCRIAGANGPVLLTVPIEGGRGTRKILKDVRISYEDRWQHVHWNSICSAYRKSAYFEYYEYRFRPFYEKKTEFLADLDIELMDVCLKILALECEMISPDEAAHLPPSDNSGSNNFTIEKKMVPYYQVFREKHGFIDGMSIIDLIFNLGPQAKEYLQQLK
ncbi:MAG TPA: WbqC family protein [Chitinophagales bacterium]|nr:WbqC family protein [Chitinophagales bacterium]